MQPLHHHSYALFNHLFAFANAQPDTVFWLRSNDYDRQLFVSDGYDALLGRPKNTLLEQPDSWKEWFLEEEASSTIQTIESRYLQLFETKQEQISHFKIVKPNGDLTFFKDTVLPLFSDNQFVAIMGIGTAMNAQQWEKEQQQQNKLIPSITEEITHVLEKELTLQQAINTPETQPDFDKIRACIFSHEGVHLSHRECQCLYHLCHGRTAKQTGERLFLGSRTVETYLDTIRTKTQTPSKLMLVARFCHYFSPKSK
ncbi:MAG: helix-turn-helix transcriptional regulator [Gammaproteobacteria bacterium]